MFKVLKEDVDKARKLMYNKMRISLETEIIKKFWSSKVQ